jgi:hypothetical protein
MFKSITVFPEVCGLPFGLLILKIWSLSFDLAQDGEPVEPFRISGFGFRISILNGSQQIFRREKTGI